jgi:thiamine pyrophosphokinase
VICADGGYMAAQAAGLRPQIIIGDLDSLPKGAKLRAGVRILLDDDRERSDLEKVLRFAEQSRFARRWRSAEVWIAGALGGRLDQLLSNLQLIPNHAGSLRVLLVDPSGTAEVVSGQTSFETKKGEVVSLFPIGEARIRSQGLKFPLRGEKLAPGSRGLSNVALGRRVSLRVVGRAWLVRRRAPWA